MTTVLDQPDITSTPLIHPSRRALVGMALAILVGYVAMMGSGTDLAYDARLEEIRSAYDGSEGAITVSSYVGMAFVALLLFFGAALRRALQVSCRSWLADATFLGFAGLGATFASWAITNLAMWKAVKVGDESAIRTIATINDAGFLPLMAAMIAVYLGTGLAGWTTEALPKWLAIASMVIGVVAPIGPLGFVGALLLPVWVFAISICVRL